MTRDQAISQVWKDHAAGLISDDEAERRDVAARALPVKARFWPTRRRPKVRDQERRKRLAFSGPMPPALASRFTVSQVAVLAIVAQHAALSVVEIAARAGVSTRTVQMTLRLAEADGLLLVRRRQLRPGWNDTNVVTIVSRDWRLWIQRGRRGGGGTGVVQIASPLWIQGVNKVPPVKSVEGRSCRRAAAPAAGRGGS